MQLAIQAKIFHLTLNVCITAMKQTANNLNQHCSEPH